MMTKRAKFAAILLMPTALVLALAGCVANNGNGQSETGGAESGASTAPSSHYTFYQDLPDGRGRVLCVWADENFHIGGISCDWEHIITDEAK